MEAPWFSLVTNSVEMGGRPTADRDDPCASAPRPNPGGRGPGSTSVEERMDRAPGGVDTMAAWNPGHAVARDVSGTREGQPGVRALPRFPPRAAVRGRQKGWAMPRRKAPIAPASRGHEDGPPSAHPLFITSLEKGLRVLEGVLKIILGSSPSVAASAESWRASAGFHLSGACAHSLCSSGAAAPTSPASV